MLFVIYFFLARDVTKLLSALPTLPKPHGLAEATAVADFLFYLAAIALVAAAGHAFAVHPVFRKVLHAQSEPRLRQDTIRRLRDMVAYSGGAAVMTATAVTLLCVVRT